MLWQMSARDEAVLQLNTEIGKLRQFRQEKLVEVRRVHKCGFTQVSC